ncbi:putative O-glycosylation ligase, exosortase A system-associated [Phenylobacterium sp. LjRoot219]|uniref:putative O-glycosylation ligase, exosortase A system-associated n=1 Tax=Phenylobacterium sp. LjRoot219 TaxID=3342283 RepID=UPI003ECC838F
MRDLTLLAALIAIVPLIFRFPIVGVLAWTWITLMNPHREVWGFLYGFKLNLIIALLTFAAWGVSRERKIVPLNFFTVALLVFAAWTSLTTYFALDPATANGLWDRTMKSIILALAVITLANSKGRIQMVVWMVVVSLGYYAVKGGAFTVLTAGANRVYGPPDSQINDNNTLGLALLILLPLVNYLRMSSRLRIVRTGGWATLALTVLAIIGTWSRGALLGLGAVLVAFGARSRAGLLLLVVGGLLATTLPSFMPAAWMNRMSSISTASEDASFNGRVAAWKTSYAIASERLVGGGFSAVKIDRVTREYTMPGSLTAGKAAHSIYFEVLGDHGFIGLFLYFIVLIAAGWNTILTLNTARGRPELAWAAQLARMMQVSMVAFLVAGAALSMAYYDGMLLILALTAAVARVACQTVGAEGPLRAGAPEWKRMTVGVPAAPRKPDARPVL